MVCLPVAEPIFNDVSHLVCKLVGAAAAAALMSFVVDEGNICFLLWVGEGEGEGVVDRPNTFLIGSVVGNVNLICGDFSAAGNDDGSSILYDVLLSKTTEEKVGEKMSNAFILSSSVQRKWINCDSESSNNSDSQHLKKT